MKNGEGQGRKRLKKRAAAAPTPTHQQGDARAPAKPADASPAIPAGQSKAKGAPLAVLKDARDLAQLLAKAHLFAMGAAAGYAPRASPAAIALGWCDTAALRFEEKGVDPASVRATERTREAAGLMWPLIEQMGWHKVELSPEWAFVAGCAVLIYPAVPELGKLAHGLIFNLPAEMPEESTPAQSAPAPSSAAGSSAPAAKTADAQTAGGATDAAGKKAGA